MSCFTPLGLSDIIITGDSAVVMGKQYTFTCSATCNPSCEFTWKYMGKTVQEEKANSDSYLEITFSDYSKTESLTCEVTNMLSNVTITTTKNLTVIGESVMLLPPDLQQILFWLSPDCMISSLHRSILSAAQLSGPTCCRWTFLSAVCWHSGPSLHFVAQEQSANTCIWKSAFLWRQRHSDVQSCLASGQRVIPMFSSRGREPDTLLQLTGNSRGRGPHPVSGLCDAS